MSQEVEHICNNVIRGRLCPMVYDPLKCCQDCDYAFKCLELCSNQDSKSYGDCEYYIEKPWGL